MNVFFQRFFVWDSNAGCLCAFLTSLMRFHQVPHSYQMLFVNNFSAHLILNRFFEISNHFFYHIAAVAILFSSFFYQAFNFYLVIFCVCFRCFFFLLDQKDNGCLLFHIIKHLPFLCDALQRFGIFVYFSFKHTQNNTRSYLNQLRKSKHLNITSE